MQPWIGKKKISEQGLLDSLKVLTISRDSKREIRTLIDSYTLCNGLLVWKTQDMFRLQRLVQDVLGFQDRDFREIATSDALQLRVEKRLKNCTPNEIQDICYVLTSKEGL